MDSFLLSQVPCSRDYNANFSDFNRETGDFVSEWIDFWESAPRFISDRCAFRLGESPHSFDSGGREGYASESSYPPISPSLSTTTPGRLRRTGRTEDSIWCGTIRISSPCRSSSGERSRIFAHPAIDRIRSGRWRSGSTSRTRR